MPLTTFDLAEALQVFLFLNAHICCTLYADTFPSQDHGRPSSDGQGHHFTAPTPTPVGPKPIPVLLEDTQFLPL
ncbi:hypothetical protein LX36DRAFT_664283 [Colletotrichum falcatum]|nr:hypothetical protein LX36DRAFT_664283 [Colletotrichum falcatum]